MAKGLWINDKTFVNFKDEKSSLSTEIATRQRSIDFYSLGMYLPNPDPVLKKAGKDIAVYNELLSDGHLGGCVTSREAGVKSLEWMIDRGKAQTRQAKIVEDMFKNMDIDNILSEILKAPLFGYSPLEVLWEKVGNYVLPKDIVGKPHEWFVFSEDNKLRFRTRENWNGEQLPPRKFLLARHKPTYQNPYGFAELSRCFWPITFKKGGYKFWVVFTEKYGTPFLIGKVPRGTQKTEIDTLADALEQMIQDAIAVIPDDSSVDMLVAQGKGASPSIFKDLIESCKSEVSIALLGQNLTTEVKGGSYAAAESHMEVRKDITDSDKKMAERVFNELIGWTWELNFNSGEKPVFSMYEQEDVDKTLAERDQILTQAGVKFTKRYFIKGYSFDEEDIEAIVDRQSNSGIPGGTPQASFSEPPLRLRGGRGSYSFAEGDWVDLYMKRIAPSLHDVRKAALDKIKAWLESLDEPPAEEAFMSEIQGILGNEYKNIEQAAIASAVDEIYTVYKMTDLLTGAEIGFGGADMRAKDFLAELDHYYLSKYIDNPDSVKVVAEFLKEKYIEGGANIFGNADPEEIQKFIDLLEQKMIEVEDWQASRIIDTAVQRTRNWAHISQLYDGAIAEIEIYEPTEECAFCKRMNGRIIKVDVAYRLMQDLTAMSPDEYEEFLKKPENAPTLDNIENMVDRALLPPYHPHCHGRIIKRMRK
jgi:phage gp29-like protein